MKNYDRINALPPKGIERKKAHIVGGGIAGFSTAAFLIDDAHMPPENITILGYSKGGMIALSAAAWTQEPRMNFVILAGCGTDKRPEIRESQVSAAPRYKGRMLSIFDAADPEFGSCQALFDAAGAGVRASERRIETGLGHQAFSRASAVWFDPTVEFVSTGR